MKLRSFITSDTPKLTAMLHRAYAELGAVGLNFTAVDHDEATVDRVQWPGKTYRSVVMVRDLPGIEPSNPAGSAARVD